MNGLLSVRNRCTSVHVAKQMFYHKNDILSIIAPTCPVTSQILYKQVLIFSGFFPVAVNFLRRIPVLGTLLNMPVIGTVRDDFR